MLESVGVLGDWVIVFGFRLKGLKMVLKPKPLKVPVNSSKTSRGEGEVS